MNPLLPLGWVDLCDFPPVPLVSGIWSNRTSKSPRLGALSLVQLLEDYCLTVEPEVRDLDHFLVNWRGLVRTLVLGSTSALLEAFWSVLVNGFFPSGLTSSLFWG